MSSNVSKVELTYVRRKPNFQIFPIHKIVYAFQNVQRRLRLYRWGVLTFVNSQNHGVELK